MTPDSPVIIEVAINGVTQPARNPHVPVTVEAIAADALDCLRAGAAIVHSHAPFSDFNLPAEQAAESYLASYRTVLAQRPDALLYPTIGGGVTIAPKVNVGANAIVGVDLDYETVQIQDGGSMLMVSASGTAVVIE